MIFELTKTCKGCAETKALSLFHLHKQMKDGRLNFCKVCFYEKAKANRAANPNLRKEEYVRRREKIGHMTRAEYTKKRNESAKSRADVCRDSNIKHKEKRVAYRKQYEQDNKDRISTRRANTLEQRREVKRLWRKNNPGLVLADSAKRRAAKIHRTPKWLTDFDFIKIKYLYQLAAMRTKVQKQQWHVDHIIPLQGAFVSGLHVSSNLRVIPAIENMQKSNHYEVA
jgi:hypothetical protein